MNGNLAEPAVTVVDRQASVGAHRNRVSRKPVNQRLQEGL